MSVRTFFIEPTERVALSLRRYVSTKCSEPAGYHTASTSIGAHPVRLGERGTLDSYPDDFVAHDDVRWPARCVCGYVFSDADAWQVFQDRIYVRRDTGEERPLRAWAKVPGAMWDAPWLAELWAGHDGRSLVVVCPNGREWTIDSPASNCTLPNDREHRCWLRTGEPPAITVGKSGPGRTCSAGGGSIQAGDYHGFLINGVFTP